MLRANRSHRTLEVSFLPLYSNVTPEVVFAEVLDPGGVRRC